jgi:hypothetical protein
MRLGLVFAAPAAPVVPAGSAALAPAAALVMPLLLGAALLPPAAVPGWLEVAFVLPDVVFVPEPAGLLPDGMVALEVSAPPLGAADCAAGSVLLLPDPPHAVCSAHAATSRCQSEGLVMARSPCSHSEQRLDVRMGLRAKSCRDSDGSESCSDMFDR